MLRLLIFVMACFGSVAGVSAQVSDIRPRPLAVAIEAGLSGDWEVAARLAARDEPVSVDVIEWLRLRAGRGSYPAVKAFLERRPDWPGLAWLRRQSESVVIEQGGPEMFAFFADAPPQSAAGVLDYAAALKRAGQGVEANAMVVKAWQTMRLSDTQHAVFLASHEDVVKPHHTARLDHLLWRGWFKDARRMLPLVSEDWQKLAEARMALRSGSGDVDTQLEAVPEALQDHAGLAHDRFEWRMRNSRWPDAKVLMLERSTSVDALGRPEGWANRRRVLARDELRDGDAKRAYALASRHFLQDGSAYADLEWLSGYIALTRLKDAELALTHFDNHDAVVRSPISKGRAGYWKGRAWQALGDVAQADTEFTKGAGYQTSFYGLLAAEAAGLPFDVGLNDVPRQDWRNSPLVQDSLFQAGMVLVASGYRSLAEQFWTHLAQQLSPEDAALLGQAAIDIDEPHLAVMIGKAVARRGVTVPVPYYALHELKDLHLPVEPALALAIARRESEFDPVVESGVGARGLMQLMPATAREVARELGLSAGHSLQRLKSEPLYNARLGSAYLAGLEQRFNGNVVMVSAGYNAGPGRPIRWMKEYGDPRGGSLDAMIDWIEGIPFRETRNYVMRVTESLPIYRARLGRDPLPRPFSAELLSR